MFEEDDIPSNNSSNRPFTDVLEKYATRRNVMKGGLTATTGFLSAPILADNDDDDWKYGDHKKRKGRNKELVGFEPVPVAGGTGTTPRVSEDYEMQVAFQWGDPIAGNSGDTIGIGHDGMTYFPLRRGRRGNDHGILAFNCEFGNNSVVIGKSTPDNLADVEASQYAHGVTLLEIKERRGQWSTVDRSWFARRIHVNTPVEFSGPVAGSSLLENAAGNEPRGTVNNCANGETPWGTYLTCEENFNGYFGSNGGWTADESQSRYGFSDNGLGYGWHLFDDRFDLGNTAYANECNRFGWVVEIDPYRPNKKPVKRTALGRFKHEGAAITVGRGGRIVVYMGDDQRFDYIYKFVSEGNWKSMRARGKSPLDHGTLYVARFNDDGSGDWLELSTDNPALSGFGSQEEILVNTRLAADVLGATPMDRPEWTTVAPNGLVYCTLTNNSQRTQANAANPLTPNADGHIIRWLDSNRHTGKTFKWEILLFAKDTHGTEESFADPDGLWADPDGRLFIQTDGGQKDGLENQMLVADLSSGEISRLFEGVSGCEITGIATTPDRRTLFANVQHPDPTTDIPKDATVIIKRKDGGVVGS